MNFLNNADQFGQGIDKVNMTLAQPAPERFESSGLQNIKEIEGGKTKGNWFKKVGDFYEVTLRNGIAVIKVVNKAKRRCPDAATAVSYITAAIEAAKAGELDELFAATQLKFKSEA
jgi:hypothetical protein